MITIKDWSKVFQKLPAVTVHKTGRVEGSCDLITGETFHFAKVRLILSPADDLLFEISLATDTRKHCEENGWIESICMGVLDVMLIGPVVPISRFRCVIDGVEIHRHSSRLAFRLAARRAAQAFMAQQSVNRIWGWGYKE